MKVLFASLLYFVSTSVGNCLLHNHHRRGNENRRVQPQYFDDYLLTVMGPQTKPSHNDVLGRKEAQTTTTTDTMVRPEANPGDHIVSRRRSNHHHRRRQQRLNAAATSTVPPVVTDDEDLAGGSGGRQDDDSGTTATTSSPTLSTTPASESTATSGVEILGYFRDVPRRHWSCCMLGKLAGDKGFHCHAGFYAARYTLRNYNRAHNRRMPLMHGPDRQSHWGLEIMFTFRRCVSRYAEEFHKCCYAATVEKREMRRWQRIREENESRDKNPAVVSED